MPKPTTTETRRHREFLRRQEEYERKYAGPFFRYLERVYRDSADAIEEVGEAEYQATIEDYLYPEILERIYRRLYMEISIEEAKLEHPYLQNFAQVEQKDIIDDLAGAIPFDQGGVIKVWRGLLRDFLEVRIATRIQQVSETTVKHVTRVIEQALGEGEGPLEIARRLRKFTNFNKNRSIAVARTETVTAQNQGKYLAALSSDLVLQKRWVPTNDGKTRHSHREFLNSPYIGLEAVFIVSKRKGGSETARYPGDSTLSAENTVNCRCGIAFKPVRNPDGSLQIKI